MTTGPTALNSEALRAFVKECISYFEFDAGVTVEAQVGREFKMLFSMCAEVTRLARGVEALRQAGLRVEGRLLARSALEYAVTAQYCYLRTDGLDRLSVTVNADSRKLYEDLAKLTKNDEYLKMRDDIEAPPNSATKLPPVQNIMDILDPRGLLLRQAYRVLSQSTHVTTTALTQHLRVNPRDRQTMYIANHEDRDAFEPQTLYTLAIACMAATWIIAHIRRDAEALDRLDSRSEELRLPLRYDDEWQDSARARRE